MSISEQLGEYDLLGTEGTGDHSFVYQGCLELNQAREPDGRERATQPVQRCS